MSELSDLLKTLFFSGFVFIGGIIFLLFSTINIIVPLIALLLGLVLIYYGLRNYLLMQKIANIPTSKVEAAAVGLIELSGRAKSISNMISPITKVKCVYWKVVLEEYQRSSGGGSRYVQVLDVKSQLRFMLEDDTGTVLIDFTGSDSNIFKKSEYYGYISGAGRFGMPRQKIDQKVIDFINNLDETTKNRIMCYQHLDTRFIEYYIPEDEKLFVFGNAEPREGVSSAVKVEDLIVKKGGPLNTIIISESGEKGILHKLKLSAILFTVEGIVFSAIYIFMIVVVHLHL